MIDAATIKQMAAFLEAGGQVNMINRHNPDGSVIPYLKRHYLVRSPEYAIYIHQFFASDQDEWLHDHPWDSGNLVVAGGYHEELFNDAGGRELHWRAPGYICERRAAEDCHRVILPQELEGTGDVWTIFWRWTRRRPWGFMVNNENWVEHEEWLNSLLG